MSLEAALEANTTAIRELIAAIASGALKSVPVVDAKKPDTPKTAPAASAQSGEPSASTPPKSSDAPTHAALFDWHKKTAEAHAELKDAEPTLDSARKAILAINSKIGRPQADAVLARFGVQAVSPKADKKGLDESQYPDFLKLCLDVLAGRVDATLAIAETA